MKAVSASFETVWGGNVFEAEGNCINSNIRHVFVLVETATQFVCEPNTASCDYDRDLAYGIDARTIVNWLWLMMSLQS